MLHHPFGLVAPVLALLLVGCGSADEKTAASVTTSTTSTTTTDPGGTGCKPACTGAAPFCDAAGTCVACRTSPDCGKGKVCSGKGADAACATGCATDVDCKAAGGDAATCCEGACVDTQSSAASCGTCGHACDLANANPTCAAGACVVDHCTPGYADCNGKVADGCESDLTADPDNCTACGLVCSVTGGVAGCSNGCVATACDAGLADCNHDAGDGCEAVLTSDPAHCGGCSKSCPTPTHAAATCAGGTCGMGACVSGYADCDSVPANGCEADLGKDVGNCGGCGKACGPDNTCWKGVCHLGGCAAGKGNCNGDPIDGCEVDLASDPANCGACGDVCGALPNATPGCAGGACGVDACLDGRLDCDALPANGCEADPTSDAMNCGSCGAACALNEQCEASACKPAPIALLSGLVAYWRFDGNVSPSVGGLPFVQGSGSPFYAGGRIGQAIGVTGGSLATPPSPQLELNTDFTLAFWANYLVHLAADSTAFEVGGIHVSSHDAWGGAMGVFVQYDAQGSNGGGFVGGDLQLVDDSGFVPPNQSNTWFFVVVERKGNALTLRVNGKGSASVDLTGKAFAAGNVQAYVASQIYGYDWGGGIDEAGFWGRALNPAELVVLYNGGAGLTLP